ncbi:MAG: hypothetical protein RL660_2622 [Bacteroidota bacterium]|jgi:hypothetical protein
MIRYTQLAALLIACSLLFTSCQKEPITAEQLVGITFYAQEFGGDFGDSYQFLDTKTVRCYGYNGAEDLTYKVFDRDITFSNGTYACLNRSASAFHFSRFEERPYDEWTDYNEDGEQTLDEVSTYYRDVKIRYWFYR